MAATGNPLRIVVCGGLGSGKSTLVAALGARGALIVEADAVGHEVIAPTGPAFAAVAARWPGAVVNGTIDRAALAAAVFTDPSELADLEAITHPHIGAEIQQLVESAGQQPVVIEVPVLASFVDEAWTWVLVDAPEELRLERAVARGMTEEDARSRMARQPTAAEWHRRADWIIANTGSVADLEEAAAELWEQLTTT